MPGLLKFTARLLTVVFVISLRTGAYARVQDQTTCPLPGKPLNEESRFGWLEIVTGPLFGARRLHSAWKVRSNVLSCARLNCEVQELPLRTTKNIHFNCPWELRTRQRRQPYKSHLLANHGNRGKHQEVGTVREMLRSLFIFENRPEDSRSRRSDKANISSKPTCSPGALIGCSCRSALDHELLCP